MEKIYYDLHIHTALSPCADNDMTPSNIVMMAKLKGLDVIAVTDHNSTKNVRAVIAASKREDGPLVIAGMELTTSEDIHVVMLFKDLESAEEFNKEVDLVRMNIANRKEVFGSQLIMDEFDAVIGEEEKLLIPATGISVDEVLALAAKYNGAAIPAHVDKPSNSITSILGTVPPDMGFKTVEVSKNFIPQVNSGFKKENDFFLLHNSDAHYLQDINEREKNFVEIGYFCIDKIIEKIINT